MTTSPTQSAASPSLFKVYREHIARDAIYRLREEEPINPSDLNPGIQEDILSWISQQHSREPGGAKEVALLTGSTDPRRSAVACSIVDACEQNESLAATFLTPTGSKVRTQSVDQLLMATLAYQISKLDGFEHLSGLVIEAIGQDMDIFTRPLVDQLDSLILKPLCLIAKRGAPRLVRDDGSPPPIVIVIDIELQKNPIEDGTRGEDENGLMDFLLRAARSSSFPFLIIATIAGGDPRRAIPSKYATEFREFSLDAKGDIHNASGIGVGTGMIDGAVRQEVTLTLSHALVEGVSGAPAEHFDTSSGPSKDFKCNCGDKSCDLKEKIRLKADLLGVSIGTAAFFLNTLKVTACISPIPGLKELSGGLLVFVTTLQAKGEVKGGFNHIIVDCLRVTCIVCEHARRHKNHVSDVVYRAIAQLQHDLEGIRKYAEKMNKRGFGHRLFMASSDKAEVNAWRQRLSISWDFFMTELLMDTHYKVTKADNVDPTELAKRIVEEMVAKHGNQMNHTIVESPPSPTDATTTAMSPPLPDNSQPLWLESLRADEDDYQYTQGDLSNGYSTNYPYFNRNPFRSLTTQPNRPNRRLAPPPHVRSDSSTPYEPTEYYAPPDPYYNQNYGYRHHPPPPPHRYYTMPPSAPSPVNNVGPAMNANFGVNYAT